MTNSHDDHMGGVLRPQEWQIRCRCETKDSVRLLRIVTVEHQRSDSLEEVSFGHDELQSNSLVD